MESQAVATIETHFDSVEDPRLVGKTDYPLINILVITICGTLCGADNWVAIENFGKAQVEWLSQFLDLEKGIPAHDTFGRVFGLLEPEQFCGAFVSWMQAVARVAAGELVALDGKQLCGSHDGYLGKQGQLHEDVAEMFAYFEKIDFAGIDHDYHRTVDSDHGHLELRPPSVG